MGRLVDEEAHIARLERSLGELSMKSPVSMSVLRILLREVLRKNGVVGRLDNNNNGILYFQITRGVSPRNHVFTDESVRGGLIITWKSLFFEDFLSEGLMKGIKVFTTRDLRWKRCDIKTTNLLPNCMAKSEGFVRGFDEAWMVDDDGNVTEGGSSNAWIVTKDDRIITREADNSILNGVTRRSILEIASSFGISVEFRGFTFRDAINAKEAFGTSAGLLLSPVVRIDNYSIGEKDPSEWRVVPKLHSMYMEHIMSLPQLC